MLLLASIVLCAVFFLFNLIMRRYVGVIFNVIWLYLLLVIRSKAPDLSPTTVGILSLMVFSFNLVYSLSQFFGIKSFKPVLFRRNSIADGNYRLSFNHTFFTVAMILTLIVLVVYSVRTIATVGINLEIIRGTDRKEAQIFNSTFDTVLFYGICGSFIHIGPLVLIYNYINDIKNKKTDIIIVIICTILFTLVDAGRMLIVRIAIFFLAAIIWNLEQRISTRRFSGKKMLIIAAVIVAALALTTSSRNVGNISFIEQTREYLAGSIVHMNYQLKYTADYTTHYGTITYGGFFYYFIKVLNLFDANLLSSNEQMSFLQSYKLLRFGDHMIYYNALVPNAFYYYYDSGYIGVALFSSILGFFTSFYERTKGQPSFFRYTMFAMALTAVFFTPLGGIFWNFRMPTVILVVLLISRFLYKKEAIPMVSRDE